MRDILLVLAIASAQTVFGWIDQVPRGPDLGDLHSRLSESALVVRGKVILHQAVTPRALPASRQIGPNLWATEPITFPRGGALFTVSVEEVYCQAADFGTAPSAQTAPPNLVRLFVPLAEPQSAQSNFDPHRRNPREWLLPNREYLLFLYEPRGQDALLKTYNLDAGQTYYRAVEGQRGAVALPDAANPEKPYTFITPLVQAVTVFCEAVKGPDAATKIRQLQGVRNFFDYPDWRKSVDEAIQVFQDAAPTPPER